MTADRRRILLIIPNLGIGGAQRSLTKLANWLSDQYDIMVAVFDNSFEPTYEIKGEVVLLGEPSNRHLFSKLFNFYKRVRKLRMLKRKQGISVSISFLEGADYLNMLAEGGDKRIISIRGSKKYDPHIKGPGRWLRLQTLIPFLYKRADKIVTVSKGLAREISLSYPSLAKKIITVPNGYTIPSYAKPINNTSYFILVWAGRMGDEKGLPELVEIFNGLRQIDCSFRLALIGDGPVREQLFEIAEKAGLRISKYPSWDVQAFKQYDIVNITSSPDLQTIFSQCDFFVLTSPSEGFPNVLLEAMLSGLPVISTDCYWGPREILAPTEDYNTIVEDATWTEYGILMPLLGNASDKVKKIWVETIISLKAKNAKERYSYKSWQRSKDFEEGLVKQQWLNLIKTIIS
jgi:glycosyltransferase involved in cell wall biosynthesis